MEGSTSIQEVEPISNLDAILEHLQKPKKLTLPKGYIRKQKTNIDFLEINDNLTTDSINNGSSSNTKNITKVDNDIKIVPKYDDNAKKTRKPTAYNIFVKATVIQLQETRPDLTPKERFQLAIRMWSENKGK
jgi:YABBY protein